ncbi:hypothetical protein Taro_037254 [Colocasia esculenta]|uniref:Uncharacterized protein n=1 Tax=Colocasia esculenta TaxID=4460 RepID=A0A843WAL8_COLES|nr:hypothetical protein [Colocasia esculenta]
MVTFGDFRFGAQIPLRERGRRLPITYGHRFAQIGITLNSRLPRLRESLAETTCGASQSQRSEVMFNSTRDLLTRSWIWVPEHRRYSHPLEFIPTPSAKELGITFRTGIGIGYVTTIRNRHSETVDKALVSRNSVPGPKFPPRASDSLDCANPWRSPHAEPPSHIDRKSCSTRREISSPACVLVHRLPYPAVGRAYLFDRGSEPPARPQFRIGASTRSVNGHIRRFPVRRPNSSPGARSQAADAIAYGHRFAQTCITFRSVIGIAYKTPIRNRNSESLDGPLLPQAKRRRFGVVDMGARTSPI